MKDFVVKSIICVILLHSQIVYAQDALVYFIGLQTPATPFVYICAPIDTTVPPSYICAPTSALTVAMNPSAQPQKVYPQTLKHNPYSQHHSPPPRYRNLGMGTTTPNYYSPQYRPYATDFTENYKNTPQLPLSSHQNINTQFSSDSWSPTSNFGARQSPILIQNRMSSPIYPQNPYINNIRSNVWQTVPQYRPDENVPSTHSNPFHPRPVYQSEITR